MMVFEQEIVQQMPWSISQRMTSIIELLFQMVSGERIAAVSQAHADMQNGQRKQECPWHLFQGISSQRLAKD